MAKAKLPVVRRPTVEEIGPAMAALNERQRAWVVAYYETGGNAAESAKRAGYAPSSSGAAAVKGCQMRQNPKIQRAMAEFIQGEANGDGARLGYEVVYKIAMNPQHPKQFDAAKLLLGLGGLSPVVKAQVDVKVELTVAEKVDRLKQMAEIMGMSPDQVLGVVDLDPTEYQEVEEDV